MDETIEGKSTICSLRVETVSSLLGFVVQLAVGRVNTWEPEELRERHLRAK